MIYQIYLILLKAHKKYLFSKQTVELYALKTPYLNFTLQVHNFRLNSSLISEIVLCPTG
jgi:hypothetical protein